MTIALFLLLHMFFVSMKCQKEDDETQRLLGQYRADFAAALAICSRTRPRFSAIELIIDAFFFNAYLLTSVLGTSTATPNAARRADRSVRQRIIICWPTEQKSHRTTGL